MIATTIATTIALKDVSKSYGDVLAVDHMTLTVEKG